MVKLKKASQFFTPKRIFFLAVFAVFAFVTQRLNFSPLLGVENQFFTLFQFVGPIAGGFLGPVAGILAVLTAEVADFLIVGKAFTPINLIRLTPMLFAAYYFATAKRNNSVLVPLASIAIFMLHPIGRTVWFLSLYWMIPVVLRLLPEKYSLSVPAKSLGATFTAHAVGSALWVWTIPYTAAQWTALVPVIAYERLLFAAGICGSYILTNAILDKALKLAKAKVPQDVLAINKKYTLN